MGVGPSIKSNSKQAKASKPSLASSDQEAKDTKPLKKEPDWKSLIRQVLKRIESLEYEGTTEEHIEWARRQMTLLDMELEKKSSTALIVLLNSYPMDTSIRHCVWVTAFFFPFLSTLPPVSIRRLVGEFNFNFSILRRSHLWMCRHAPAQAKKLLSLPFLVTSTNLENSQISLDYLLDLVSSENQQELSILWWNYLVESNKFGLPWILHGLTYLKHQVPPDLFQATHARRLENFW